MNGLVLEGGGTRGAYHIGAIQALLEHDIEINIVTGTSIGAINGAMFASGRFDELKALYMNIEPSQIIEGSDAIYDYLSQSDVSVKKVSDYGRALAETLLGGGFDISPLKKLLEEQIDEAALREGKIQFGLVTVDLAERKAKELLLPEIPEGELIDYILASAYLPVFKADKRIFLDGGFFNNLPLDLLLRAGEVDKVYIIRTMAMGRHQSLERDVNKVVISPSVDLGPTLLINRERIQENIRQGYFDTMRVLDQLDGKRYNLKNKPPDYFFQLFASLSEEQIRGIAAVLGEAEIEHPRRYLFESILPGLEKVLDLRHADYEDIGLELFERFAIDQGIDRFQVLDFGAFLKLVTDEAKQVEPVESIGLVNRFNLFLATTVRLNWNDLQDIIRAIMVQLLGGMDG